MSDVVFRLRDNIICYTFAMFSVIDNLGGACGREKAEGEGGDGDAAQSWDTHLARLSRNE